MREEEGKRATQTEEKTGPAWGACACAQPGGPSREGQGPHGGDRETRKAQSAVLLVGSRGRPCAG